MNEHAFKPFPELSRFTKTNHAPWVAFTSQRLSAAQKEYFRKQNRHVYELRESDEGFDPATIEHGVMVNHFGTMVSSSELVFPKKRDRINITSDMREHILNVMSAGITLNVDALTTV